MIHVAILHLKEPNPETGETEMVFASLDGDSYLPVSRKPEPGEEDAVARIFEPDERGFQPMRFARRAMDPWWWPTGLVDRADHLTV